MLHSGRLVAWCSSVSLLVGLAACGGTTEPPGGNDNPMSIVATGGNVQTGPVGTALAQPLAVLVKTGAGAAAPGVTVTWATSSGGSFGANTSVTDASGRATATWTLGATAGQQTATASLSGASGSPVTFTASAIAPSNQVTVTGVTPSPMVEGQAATITGTGFGSTTAGLTVTIDGATATVTQVTPTALTVTVPATSCKPARSGDVRVTLSATQSNVFAAALAPAAFFNLAVGQQSVLQDPAAFCLQFAGATGSEDYLIGVQSTSETISSLTPVTLTATASGASVAALPSLSRSAGSAYVARMAQSAGIGQSDRAPRWERHRAAELRRHAAEAVLAHRAQRIPVAGGRAAVSGVKLLAAARAGTTRSMGGPRLSASVSALDGITSLQVGDMVSANVPSYVTNQPCTAIPVTAVVRAVGTHSVWLEDTSNPAGGYSAADYNELAAKIDNLIYATDASWFGAPTDLDGNNAFYVLVTKETNRQGGVLGFVSSTDFFAQASCASSNQGEIFYGTAPDPTGTYALGAYPLTQAKADAPFLIAHELTHVIQMGRRLYVAGGPLMASWTSEGQATMGEQVVGFADEGHALGQNLGFAPASNQDDPNSTDWNSDRFVDLMMYFGLKDASTKVPGAPGECSYLAGPPTNPGPCLGGRDMYGVPWSLLQWITDQYGPSFPGGPQGLHQSIINSTQVGYANLEAVTGTPIKTMLARWAAALYVDDRVPGLDPKLALTTWNLHDIFDVHLVESARLVPNSQGFGTFTQQANVRAGSTAYFRVSGTNRSATAIKARGASDAPLPANMQVFVVRLR
jgi:hypothetical protein